MKHQAQICFRNVEETQAIRGAIDKQVQRLERFFPKIIGCNVTVAAPHHHHRKGNPFQVRVDISVPGREIIVSPHPQRGGAGEDLYSAISGAFQAAIRCLRDYFQIRRGEVKRHAISTKPRQPDENETELSVDPTEIPFLEMERATYRANRAIDHLAEVA